MQYRADIDGIRAIAVLAVVLFHLEVPGFSGGFIGVDVFFVISGFLITALIESRCRAGRFTFIDFYSRRIRRLIPALIATVLVTFAASAAIMTPYDLIAMARSAFTAIFSVSNINFYLESGYWDEASVLKPLLHTWSLGVEEQFYLLWPALVVALVSLARGAFFSIALVAITIVGAALCIVYTQIDAAAAFYLLPFRVFQFSMGALVIVIARSSWQQEQAPRRSTAQSLGLVGLTLIVFATAYFDSSTVFPGWAALVPSIGAMLLLLSGHQASQSNGVLSLLLVNPVSRWLGKVSYAMYLVHWPIIVLYRYQFGLELNSIDITILAVATLLGTVLLHYGIETRFYHRSNSAKAPETVSRRTFNGAVLATMIALAAASGSAWLGDGWAWRQTNLQLTPAQIQAGMQKRFADFSAACSINNPRDSDRCHPQRPVQVLILGNSHEPDGYNLFKAAYADDQMNMTVFGSINSCQNIVAERNRLLSPDAQCQQKLDTLFSHGMPQHFDIVVYSANMPFAPNKGGVELMLNKLKASNPKLSLITIGGYINTKVNCARLINQTGTTSSCAEPENVRYFANKPGRFPRYESIMSITDHYIDRVQLLCTNGLLERCITETPERVPMFYDEHHQSLEFATMTGKLYRDAHPELIEQLLQPGGKS